MLLIRYTCFFFLLGRIDDSFGRVDEVKLQLLLGDSLLSSLSTSIHLTKPILLEIGGLTLRIYSVDHTYNP